MTSTPPTGTVTFLFTDSEDSKRLWEQHPQKMRIADEPHNQEMWEGPPIRVRMGIHTGKTEFQNEKLTISALPAEFPPLKLKYRRTYPWTRFIF